MLSLRGTNVRSEESRARMLYLNLGLKVFVTRVL